MSSYVSQSSLKARMSDFYSFENRLDRHLFDIFFSAYPQEWSHVDFVDVIENRKAPPYGFLSFSVDAFAGEVVSLSLDCRQYELLNDGMSIIVPSFFASFVPNRADLYELPAGNFKLPCFTWRDLCKTFFAVVWNFLESMETFSCRTAMLRIGTLSQLSHLELRLLYHHQRWHVSYYGFSFGDEYDDRLFVRHPFTKCKDYAPAWSDFRTMVFTFLGFYVLPLPDFKAE